MKVIGCDCVYALVLMLMHVYMIHVCMYMYMIHVCMYMYMIHDIVCMYMYIPSLLFSFVEHLSDCQTLSVKQVISEASESVLLVSKVR